MAQKAIQAFAGGRDHRPVIEAGGAFLSAFPRTPRAPALLENERRWLPVLAPGLPLPVPVPVRAGEPSPSFPRTWSVVRWVDGEPADHTPLIDPQAASTLAGFLGALHCTAPGGAPANSNRGVPLPALQDNFEESLDYIFPARSELLRAAEPGPEAPHSRRRRRASCLGASGRGPGVGGRAGLDSWRPSSRERHRFEPDTIRRDRLR